MSCEYKYFRIWNWSNSGKHVSAGKLPESVSRNQHLKILPIPSSKMSAACMHAAAAKTARRVYFRICVWVWHQNLHFPKSCISLLSDCQKSLPVKILLSSLYKYFPQNLFEFSQVKATLPGIPYFPMNNHYNLTVNNHLQPINKVLIDITTNQPPPELERRGLKKDKRRRNSISSKRGCYLKYGVWIVHQSAYEYTYASGYAEIVKSSVLPSPGMV